MYCVIYYYLFPLGLHLDAAIASIRSSDAETRRLRSRFKLRKKIENEFVSFLKSLKLVISDIRMRAALDQVLK